MSDQTGGTAAEERRQMVSRDLMSRGISDPRVLEAMARVRRERFVPPSLAPLAYRDRPLPIAEGQTISQPFIVAYSAQSAEIAATDRVLEVGTGSGYAAAVLGCLACEVWTIERHPTLAKTAGERLLIEGYGNVHVRQGDGTLGLVEQSPFDAIVVTAAAPNVPTALREQLVDGGRLVLPVGSRRRAQKLLLVRREGDRFVEHDLGGVRFVPLIGEQGWSERRR